MEAAAVAPAVGATSVSTQAAARAASRDAMAVSVERGDSAMAAAFFFVMLAVDMKPHRTGDAAGAAAAADEDGTVGAAMLDN